MIIWLERAGLFLRWQEDCSRSHRVTADSLADAFAADAVEIAGQMRSVAFVIAKPGTTPKEADVIAPAGKIMAAFKVPARVWYVEEFPTVESANGVKIQRGKLRDMALERLRDDQGSISRR